MTYNLHNQEALADAASSGAGQTSECGIVVSDPSGQVVKEDTLDSDSREGALAHAAQADGSHSICVRCDSSVRSVPRKMKWSIAFDVLGGDVFGGEAGSV